MKKLLDVSSLTAAELRSVKHILRQRKGLNALNKKMGDYICVDCGYQTLWDEYYAVTAEVWSLTGLAEMDGMLCIGCLEKRIGRKLCVWDFDPDAAVNWGTRDSPFNRKSERLLDRLGISKNIWELALQFGGRIERMEGKWIYVPPNNSEY